jgi:DnaJ-class molecular chaperone
VENTKQEGQCESCNGLGRVLWTPAAWIVPEREVECSDCRGTGRMLPQCPFCEGTGKTKKAETEVQGNGGVNL